MHQEFPLLPDPSIPPTLLPGWGKLGAHLPPAVSPARGVRGYPRTVRSRSAAPRPRRRPRHRARATLRGSRIQPCQIPAALSLPPVSSFLAGGGLELLAPAPRGPTPPPPSPRMQPSPAAWHLSPLPQSKAAATTTSSSSPSSRPPFTSPVRHVATALQPYTKSARAPSDV